jgi:hypothetical protein
MKWEYKRILFTGNLAINDITPDPVEDSLNNLGNDGWELVSTTNIDGSQNSRFYKDTCLIEYIFKREVQK